ncbi:MAG: glycosyltransferase [Bacteroidia bacterium]
MQTKKTKPTTASANSITVIIPARNEAANIEACLQAVLAQDQPNFEIILVNDHSTDNTAELARAIAKGDKRLQVIDLHDREQNAYKKAAITQAISLAKGDIIVQTDADCTMGPQWLSSMHNAFVAGADLVSGPVKLQHNDSLFGKLQALEHQGLVMLGGGSLLGGFPNMANGANLAYRRSSFYQVGGFNGISDVASGDDELLLQKMHQAGMALDFVQDKDAIVYTPAMEKLSGFKAQRLRWVSKAKSYQNRMVNVVQLISYMAFWAFPAWALMARWDFLWGGIALKIAVDFLLMLHAARFFRTFRLLWLLPVLEPLYLIYVLWVGIAGNLVKTYTWKDRSVS